jgi:uncharacterized protein YjiS (DUF1127 family)
MRALVGAAHGAVRAARIPASALAQFALTIGRSYEFWCGYEALNRLSDRQLEERGLRRENIVRAAMRDAGFPD